MTESASTSRPARRAVSQLESVTANRTWWDAEAEAYYAEHGSFLGDDALVWGPEGVDEARLRVLGDLTDHQVLEIGAGAAQGARFVQRQGAHVVATDLSAGMLRRARLIDAKDTSGPAETARRPVPLVQCDGTSLPFPDAAFDVVFTAYGVVPFVADSAGLMRECARVLRPGGRFVFSTTHPIRWCLPDEPGPAGLTVTMSYFDRTPYAELDGDVVGYVEHHRTLGDRVREIRAAGLTLDDLIEPGWPEDNTQTWGGWSPLRGELVPGTAIFVCRRP